MRKSGPWLILLVIAGCSFDAGGLGSHATDDASVPGTADAPATTADAPPGTPDAMVTTPDAPVVTTPDASEVGVACGNMTCTGGDVCCVPRGGGGNPQCQQQCDGGTNTFACDGPEDCSGTQVCCMSQSGSSCSDSCGFGQAQACHQQSDCSGIDTCCPVQGTAVSICQTVCF